MTHIKNVWNGGATLGEGPVWDERRGTVWFTDIKSRRVHCFAPATGMMQQWDAPAQIGWVFPADNGLMLAGLQTGLHVFDPQEGAFRMRCKVEPDRPRNRLNDATIAADGAVWFGSMDDGESERSGRFYRWDGAAVADVALPPVCITNGPALSPDQRTLYHVDTVGGIVYASALDEQQAVISTREFTRIDRADGHPDGCIDDAMGNLWLGLWGGWCVRQYAPNGDLVREVRLPVSNVTKVALGGPDLKTAFVTTARAGLTEAQLVEQPMAGGLFAFPVDVAGIAAPLARINDR